MPDTIEVLLKRQKSLADFGDFALRSEDLDAVLQEACRLVAEALGTGRAKVLEVERGSESLLVRAGVGWDAGIVGQQRIPLAEHSSESFSIRAGKPVISEDIGKEDRFDVPAFMKEAGVVALANVPIVLPGRRAYGLLEVDDTRPRDFEPEDTEFLRTYATLLGSVIDRLLKVGELGSSEERFRAIVETARDYAIFTTDIIGRIEAWPPGAQAVFGWTADEAVGQPADITFTPEDREAGLPEKERQQACEAGQAPDVRWHQRRDGSRVFIEGVARPLADSGGRVRGFLKVGQDVTERRHAEQALAESERRARSLLESIPQLVWRAVDHGDWIWASPQWTAFTGQAEADSHGLGWLEPVHPDDRGAAMAAWARVEQRGGFDVEYRLRDRTGAYAWFSTHASQVRDDDGRIVEWLGSSTDVDALRRLQERQGVLVAELQHRTRNLIAVVQALAHKTLERAESPEDFGDRFGQRLAALGRVQGLLSHVAAGQRVSFNELLRSELAALGALDGDDREARVTLDGPPGVPLRSATVQTFALALHELATNAAKYGALAAPRGRLAVRWRVGKAPDAAQGDGSPWLRVEWQESGVAMPEANAPARGGYGRELIERALPYQLGARTTYELGSDGVRCTLAVPIASG